MKPKELFALERKFLSFGGCFWVDRFENGGRDSGKLIPKIFLDKTQRELYLEKYLNSIDKNNTMELRPLEQKLLSFAGDFWADVFANGEMKLRDFFSKTQREYFLSWHFEERSIQKRENKDIGEYLKSETPEKQESDNDEMKNVEYQTSIPSSLTESGELK